MSWFSFLQTVGPLLLQGMTMTFKLLLAAAATSFTMGAVLGVVSAKRFQIPILTPLVEIMTFGFRATPFFVQLLIVYFVIPDLMGCSLSAFAASVIALGMCSSGYVAQIIRGGINSVPVEQWEAAFALGYSTLATLWFVILPQAFRSVLPMLNNELESLLKSTAITASIGLLEITRVGMNIVSREMNPVPIYLTIAVLYMCISAVFLLLSRLLEQRMSYARGA